METHTKTKKSNTNKFSHANSFNESVIAQELEQKIKQYENIQRRVRIFDLLFEGFLGLKLGL